MADCNGSIISPFLFFLSLLSVKWLATRLSRPCTSYPVDAHPDRGWQRHCLRECRPSFRSSRCPKPFLSGLPRFNFGVEDKTFQRNPESERTAPLQWRRFPRSTGRPPLPVTTNNPHYLAQAGRLMSAHSLTSSRPVRPKQPTPPPSIHHPSSVLSFIHPPLPALQGRLRRYCSNDPN